MKDDEVYALAKPIWDNLVKSSNLKFNFIKTSIVVSLAEYYGVILVGTFLTFN